MSIPMEIDTPYLIEILWSLTSDKDTPAFTTKIAEYYIEKLYPGNHPHDIMVRRNEVEKAMEDFKKWLKTSVIYATKADPDTWLSVTFPRAEDAKIWWQTVAYLHNEYKYPINACP